jgi:hypothetical protein
MHEIRCVSRIFSFYYNYIDTPLKGDTFKSSHLCGTHCVSDDSSVKKLLFKAHFYPLLRTMPHLYQTPSKRLKLIY